MKESPVDGHDNRVQYYWEGEKEMAQMKLEIWFLLFLSLHFFILLLGLLIIGKFDWKEQVTSHAENRPITYENENTWKWEAEKANKTD